MSTENNLNSLIPLDDFKAVSGVDDREDRLAKFCLVTATCTIEQYCNRKLCFKTNHQLFKEWDNLTLFLNEYPVNEVLMVSARFANSETEILGMRKKDKLTSKDYYRHDKITNRKIPNSSLLIPHYSLSCPLDYFPYCHNHYVKGKYAKNI